MRRIACVFVVSLFAVVPAAVGQNQSPEELFLKSGGASRILNSQVFGAYGKLPLSFEANKGQSPPEAKFLARGLGYELFLTQKGAVLALSGPLADGTERQILPGSNLILPEAKDLLQLTRAHPRVTASIVSMEVIGANPGSKIVGAEELPGINNYFVGNDPKKWRTNVPTFAKVKYQGIYPGIDLVYYGNQGRLEYDFVVAPGANPQKIRLSATGTAEDPTNNKSRHFLSIDTNGDLVVSTESGEVRYQKPVAYQQAKNASSNSIGDESKQLVDARFLLKSGNEVGFEVGSYDATRPLVIDPTLVYSSFLTGNYYENGNAIIVDSSGYAYVTGVTYSSVPSFPVSPGAYQQTCGTDTHCNSGSQTYTFIGNTDAFVTKMNLDGSALVWSTYLGGSYDEAGKGIAVDSSGNVYVAGYTRSSDFPTTTGAFQTTCAPYVTSPGVPPNCPVFHLSNCGGGGTDGKFSASGIINAFVTKLNSTGTALVYSTFVGGTGNSDAVGLAIDAAGEAYIVGHTDSSGQYGYTQSYPGCPLGYANAHPTTASGFMAAPPLSFTGWPGFLPNGYLTVLSADGKSLVYSTYLGSTGPYLNQYAVAVAVDSNNAAYVTGYTNSPTFPTTPGAFQTSLNRNGGVPGPNCGGANCLDAFVAKFDPSRAGAASLVYSTFLGGSGSDIGLAIAVDSMNNAYVAGQTNYNGAPSPDFPTTAGAFQSSCPSPAPCQSLKGFLTKLNAAGSAEVYSSYLGGSSSDGIGAIALDSTGRAYVTGSTNSNDFPNKNAVQLPPPGGASNAFVLVFKADGSDLDFSSFLGGSSHTFGQAIALDPSENIYLTGYTLDQNFPVTQGAFQTSCAHCGTSGTNQAAFVTKISALSGAVTPATITLSNLSYTYDGTPKAATATTNPPGLTVVSVTYTGTGGTVYGPSTVPPTNAGSYSVDASLSNANYQAPDATGTLVISPANQTISFPTIGGQTYGNQPFAISATASSGLPVSFSVSGSCSLAGTTVTITGAGSCTITVSQAGNANYNSAASVSQTVTIAKANQTISWPTPGNIVYGTALNSTQLNATVSVPGTSPAGALTYSPAAGMVLGPGSGQTLNVSVAGTANYNSTSATVKINVLYAGSGMCDGSAGHTILQPINADGSSVWKQGSTVPVKFRVCDVNGVSIGTAGVITNFVLYKINSGTIAPVDETPVNSTNDLAWHFDSTAQQWIFNLSTKTAPQNVPNQTYYYEIDLNDGTSIFFQFGLK